MAIKLLFYSENSNIRPSQQHPVRQPSMIISHRHKFIYLKARKVAGTSVEVALARHCGKRAHERVALQIARAAQAFAELVSRLFECQHD